MSTIEIIFWLFLFVVFYTYLGYGIFLYFLVLIKECFVKKTLTPSSFTDLPEVTLLIAAYNEEDIVDDKMLNTRSLDYPKEKLKVVWITDGTTDASNEKLAAYNEVQVLFEPARQGKTAALNRAIPYIKSPIVVFTDANTMLNSLAITEIVNAFRDVKTGCVAGEKRIASKEKDSASSGGEGIYWKYESILKSLDSRLYSAVGAAGELFAIRRELFEKMDKDTLLDDFILSMKIAMKGYKICYCSNAYAIETGTLNMAEEKKRKIRIAAGGVQSVYRLAPLLNVFKYGVLSFQYISHRVLRWTITPVLLFLLFPVNIALVIADNSILYSILLFMQVLFYFLALLGKHYEGKELKNKFIFIPHYFLFMNLNVVKGFFYLLKKKRGDGTWDKSQRMKN
ncbi:MAG: glycosyltransferase family 2 protein [Bacteroidales bacterium]|nr:glycosyltransferase family 2 protein [Bacteroidales bacterium]